jgi:hypothetical protein
MAFSMLIRLFCYLSMCLQFVSASPQQPAAASSESLPPGTDSPAGLAQQIIQQAGEVGCEAGDCRILVTDFILPGGQTSSFGMKMADAFCSQFSKTERPFLVVERAEYRSFLQKERLVPKLQHDEAVARWLARQLNANAVLIGETTRVGPGKIEVKARLLSVDVKNPLFVAAQSVLHVDDIVVDLYPTEALASLPALPDMIDGQALHRGVIPGAVAPACPRIPFSPRTEAAEAAHFRGLILVDTVMGVKGRFEVIRIFHGAPYGLNEPTLRAVQAWRCKPGTLNGKAVPMQYGVGVQVGGP